MRVLIGFGVLTCISIVSVVSAMIFSCMLFGMAVVFFSSCLVFNIVIRSGYIVSVIAIVVNKSIMVSKNSAYNNANAIVESISIFPFVCVSIFIL